MDKNKIKELLENADPKALRLEPSSTYDYAIIGLTSDGRIVYSEQKILFALQEFENLDYDEALEWYEYNTSRGASYAGKKAPIIVTQEP